MTDEPEEHEGTGPETSSDEVYGDVAEIEHEPETEEEEAPKRAEGRNIDAMLNVGLQVQIILGRSKMPISQLLKLSRGSIIELDKKIGEPVEVMINDRLVAKGDLVKIAGDRLGVSLTEIVKDYMPGE